jgi:elongation factor P--(R)-beta-lysine ligase
MNLIQIIQNRHYLKTLIRKFFERSEYLEVDTPVLTICPGTEVHLQYFKTNWIDHYGCSHKKFLRSSPELHMKQLIAAGAQKIFQLGPCFRNHGEIGPWHHPEFSMLEWYSVGQSYQGLIDETEQLLRYTAESMSTFTGISSDKILPKKFEQIGVVDAFREFAKIDLIDLDPDLAKKAVTAGVVSVNPEDDFETAFFKTLIEKLEPAFGRLKGVILCDYLPSQAALSKIEDGRACRFEFYLGRVELCNGFFELTGEIENRERIESAFLLREQLGYEAVPMDETFFKSMTMFNAPCAGNALGFDRWLNLLISADNLDSSVLFRDNWNR